ncbi:MAG: fimbrillin family protein [Prevotella sp.]|jgi:hypothetical protein|nr:fimbrillin family protein [Prevotella sp.]
MIKRVEKKKRVKTKTKRFSWLLAAIPLLMSGCIFDGSDGDTAAPKEIRFSTDVCEPSTRASYTGATFTEFLVTSLGDATPYFQNLKVTKQSGGDWETASTKYWPPYPLRFFGYAPASLKEQVTVDNSQQKLTGYQPASNAINQADIVTAYVRANQNSAKGAAVLGFRHALSQIEVVAKNGDPTKYTVEVLGVKISRIPSTADMTFQTDANADPVWSTASGPEDYIIKGTTPITLTATQQSIMFGDHNFLLIPQELLAWTGGSAADGAYLSVLCRIKDELSNCIYPTDPTKYGFAALPVDQVWQSGHKYIYNVAFFTNGGGAGKIDPNPVNPQDPSDADVDTTPGGPGRQGGDLVISDTLLPIEVSVSIIDWTTGTNDNIDLEF